MTSKCFKCDAENEDGSKFCMSCGVEFDKEALCAGCGQLIKVNQAFCSECGRRAQPTDGEELKAFVREWFFKLFPNFQGIKASTPKQYWGALIKGVVVAGICGAIAMFAFVVAVDIAGGRSYTEPNNTLSKVIGWIVNVYVLWRWQGHVIAGRVLDIEVQKRAQFDIIGLVYLTLAVLGAFNLGFATLSYLVLFGGTIYLGTLPSYQKNIESVCVDKDDATRC